MKTESKKDREARHYTDQLDSSEAKLFLALHKHLHLLKSKCPGLVWQPVVLLDKVAMDRIEAGELVVAHALREGGPFLGEGGKIVRSADQVSTSFVSFFPHPVVIGHSNASKGINIAGRQRSKKLSIKTTKPVMQEAA